MLAGLVLVPAMYQTCSSTVRPVTGSFQPKVTFSMPMVVPDWHSESIATAYAGLDMLKVPRLTAVLAATTTPAWLLTFRSLGMSDRPGVKSPRPTDGTDNGCLRGCAGQCADVGQRGRVGDIPDG